MKFLQTTLLASIVASVYADSSLRGTAWSQIVAASDGSNHRGLQINRGGGGGMGMTVPGTPILQPVSVAVMAPSRCCSNTSRFPPPNSLPHRCCFNPSRFPPNSLPHRCCPNTLPYCCSTSPNRCSSNTYPLPNRTPTNTLPHWSCPDSILRSSDPTNSLPYRSSSCFCL